MDIDRGQLVGRRLKDVAVVVGLDEFAPVGRRAMSGRDWRRFERLAVVALLAKALAIDSAAVTVVSGHTSPAKVLEIEGLDTEGVRQTLAEGE